MCEATVLPMCEAPWTLATVALEATSSMRRCEAGLSAALSAAVRTVQARPDADRLLLRVVLFSTDFGGVWEIHGFTPVSQLNADDYRMLHTVGMAPLVDAMYETVKKGARSWLRPCSGRASRAWPGSGGDGWVQRPLSRHSRTSVLPDLVLGGTRRIGVILRDLDRSLGPTVQSTSCRACCSHGIRPIQAR